MSQQTSNEPKASETLRRESGGYGVLIPIEHPNRIERYAEALSKLTWQEASQRNSLEVLFNELSELTYAELQYYYGRRVSSRGKSQIFRLIAWSLATVGLLIPLLSPVVKDPIPPNFLSYGYIAFALAGSVLLADNLFAGTNSFLRNTKTQLEIERLYSIFSIEWHATLAAYDAKPSTDTLAKAFERAVDYVKALHTTMGTETAAWETALEAGVGELRGSMTAPAANRPPKTAA